MDSKTAKKLEIAEAVVTSTLAIVEAFTPKKRVPRKLKKRYKKLWSERLGYEVKIKARSVRFGPWQDTEKKVWGCEVYPAKQVNQ